MATGKPLSFRTSLGWAALAVAALAVAIVPPPPAGHSTVQRHIRVSASSFEYAPAVIAVNPGDQVTLELASSDVVHGLFVDGYELNVTAEPGQPARLTFVADRPGVFRWRCSVSCGPLHPFMAGRLKVGPPLTFYAAVVLAAMALAFGGTALRRPGAGAGIRASPA